MAGLRGRAGDNQAQGKALSYAIGISVVLLIFSLLAHWLPWGGAPIGGSVFNQLTVAQFIGGVGGGIGAVIVGATLWLQNRALEDLRQFSQTSHQFEAYALWRALDESIDQRTTLAVANVLSALLAAIRDTVLPASEQEVIAALRTLKDDDDYDAASVTRTPRTADIEVRHLFGDAHVTVTAEYEVEFFGGSKEVEKVPLPKIFAYEAIATRLGALEFAEVSNDASKHPLLSGEELTDEDVRRTRHLATRFIMYLDEAEKLDCAAQCAGLVSDLAVRQYLDLLIRIRSNRDARKILETWLQRDNNGQIDNILVGSPIWDAEDVLAWQKQGAEAVSR